MFTVNCVQLGLFGCLRHHRPLLYTPGICECKTIKAQTQSVFIFFVPHSRQYSTYMPLCDIWQQRRAVHFSEEIICMILLHPERDDERVRFGCM